MTPRTSGGDGFGDVATATNKGQVKFVTETVDRSTIEQGRITRVLDHAGIPDDFYVVFSRERQPLPDHLHPRRSRR